MSQIEIVQSLYWASKFYSQFTWVDFIAIANTVCVC